MSTHVVVQQSDKEKLIDREREREREREIEKEREIISSCSCSYFCHVFPTITFVVHCTVLSFARMLSEFIVRVLFKLKIIPKIAVAIIEVIRNLPVGDARFFKPKLNFKANSLFEMSDLRKTRDEYPGRWSFISDTGRVHLAQAQEPPMLKSGADIKVQSDPDLVTSSGERVLATKSGWSLNGGQVYPVWVRL
eukprot:sb/3471035/